MLSERFSEALTYATCLLAWVESHDLGEVFSSSAGFRLANSAVKSPDAAFVAKDRLPQGWNEGEDQFLDLAPDLAIEIRSKTDSLSSPLKTAVAGYWVTDKSLR